MELRSPPTSGGPIRAEDCTGEIQIAVAEEDDLPMAPPPEPPAAKMSIMERRAVAGGFCAPRIDVERFRCGGSLPSPCFVLPPSICPSVLLDSPVLMTFSQVRGSLSTVTFVFSS